MSDSSDKSLVPLVGQGLKVLVIDDDRSHAEAIAESLARVGYNCFVATSGTGGARAIDREEFDLVLTDLKMADMDGLAILRKVRSESPDTEVIVITGHGDVKTAVEAIKQGAANYLTKPIDLVELRAMVAKATERLHLLRDNRELKRRLDERFGFEGLIGNSAKWHEVIRTLRSIAETSATVLILGETGTGKELVARAIHNNSPRRSKPFADLTVTTLNENLLDDELFGHDAGAFTGADRARKGRFEHANGGTVFLDEIGDMPLHLQSKLLKVLENREVIRIGSNEPIKVNVRLISATHQDLESLVSQGKFRADLYHRIKVVPVRLPPLRERREDIPLLAAHFIKEMNAVHGKHVTSVADPVRRAMATYHWPGNVRELRNFIEGMVVLDQDGVLNLDDARDSDVVRQSRALDGHVSGAPGLVGRPLSEVERYYIEQALEVTEGNREEAAKMLGIGERTLYRNIQDWKLQDQVKEALELSQGDLAAAAERLGMKEAALERKMKKWGWRDGDDTSDADEPAEE
jgi:two-component system response regulator HydG